MPRQPIVLPSKTFASKSEASAFFKDMLNRYSDGEDIGFGDDNILFELIQNHPETTHKIGVGVKKFFRARSQTHPTSCFHIERIDGTITDFSYVSCITGSPSTLYQQFYSACRYAVAPELILQKQNLFDNAGGTLACAKTGILVTIDNSEYRHTSPRFGEIVDAFIYQQRITLSPSLITHGKDLQYVAQLDNKNMESTFRQFHAAKAKLAIFKKYER